MINFKDLTIHQNYKIEQIRQWSVWFRTPLGGLFNDYHQAIKNLEECDLDPQQLLIPVCVAIGDTLYEEVRR